MDESGIKKKQCWVRKQVKQRVTVAFSVNAEPLIIIGKSKMLRCFRKLCDQSHPAGCHYFANPKMWMQSELMICILQALNARMKNAGRNIILFLDNW